MKEISMATINIPCWKCGHLLSEVPIPVSRREACPACLSAVRACRGCDFHQPLSGKACAEPQADPVADAEAGNTCDYFRPSKAALEKDGEEAKEARQKLEQLFGSEKNSQKIDPLKEEAKTFSQESEDEAEAARQKLEKLFGHSK